MLKKCDGRTNGQTDLCIELRYAQLIKQYAKNMHFGICFWPLLLNSFGLL